jgi:putative membrane protein
MRTVVIVISVLLVVAILLGGGIVIGRLVAPGRVGFNRGFEGPLGHHFFGYAGTGWFGVIPMILAMIFLWLLVPLGIGAAIWSAVARGRGRAPGRQAESSLEILQRRYAQGEITREEFLERRETLQGGPKGGNES